MRHPVFKRKNRWGGRFDRKFNQLGELLNRVTGYTDRRYQENCSFSVATQLGTHFKTSPISLSYISITCGCCQWRFACRPVGLKMNYQEGRGAAVRQAERGVRAYSPAWSERPKPSRDTSSVSYERAYALPERKKAEQVSGKRQESEQESARGAAGRNHRHAQVLSGFIPPLT